MNQEKKPEVKIVPLSWGSTEELQTLYVNHLFISHGGDEFYLTFGELPAPIYRDEADIPEEIRILPKVRLAVTPEAMKKISKTISENVEKFEKKIPTSPEIYEE